MGSERRAFLRDGSGGHRGARRAKEGNRLSRNEKAKTREKRQVKGCKCTWTRREDEYWRRWVAKGEKRDGGMERKQHDRVQKR